MAKDRGWSPAEGDRYLDFGSGVAVNALGHAHPRLVAALTAQAAKLWHTSNLYRVAGQEALAERLVAATFADKVFFCNSGAEACEGAIKAARRYHYVSGQPERWRIITFQGAFHGRTLATLAAAGNEKYLEGFGPELAGFDHVPFGDLEAVAAAIGPETAAIMLEPIQGEGGVREPSPEFLRGLRELCDEHGLLLVLDEVQTGVGRTGKLFAHEWAGVTPDIMAIAKGIGGGFPMGAVLATDEAAQGPDARNARLDVRRQSACHGGRQRLCSTSCSSPGFLEAVQLKALRLKQGLARLKDQFPDIVLDVRGQGLLDGREARRSPAGCRRRCACRKTAGRRRRRQRRPRAPAAQCRGRRDQRRHRSSRARLHAPSIENLNEKPFIRSRPKRHGQVERYSTFPRSR